MPINGNVYGYTGECEDDNECGNHEGCYNYLCQDPCLRDACGVNADCRGEGHSEFKVQLLVCPSYFRFRYKTFLPIKPTLLLISPLLGDFCALEGGGDEGCVRKHGRQMCVKKVPTPLSVSDHSWLLRSMGGSFIQCSSCSLIDQPQQDDDYALNLQPLVALALGITWVIRWWPAG